MCGSLISCLGCTFHNSATTTQSYEVQLEAWPPCQHCSARNTYTVCYSVDEQNCCAHIETGEITVSRLRGVSVYLEHSRCILTIGFCSDHPHVARKTQEPRSKERMVFEPRLPIAKRIYDRVTQNQEYRSRTDFITSLFLYEAHYLNYLGRNSPRSHERETDHVCTASRLCHLVM